MDVPLPAGVLKGRFTVLLSEQVRPFLRVRGFAKSGPTFSRRRGRLYDVINFQGSKGNGLGALHHRFYVNVGVGSIEVDGVAEEEAVKRPELADCLVERRWAGFADGAPREVVIFADSDPDELADEIRHWLGEVLAFLDTVDRTDVLVDLAIEGNFLHGMQKTCAYLARIDDIERLRRYVGTLRDRFGTETRWTIFNRQITDAVGPRISELHGPGCSTNSHEDRRHRRPPRHRPGPAVFATGRRRRPRRALSRRNLIFRHRIGVDHSQHASVQPASLR